MKTLHTTLGFSRLAGGLQESVSSLCRTLMAEQKLNVLVCGPQDRFCGEDLPRWYPVPTVALRVAIPQLSYMPLIYKTISEYDPDVMHTHGLWLHHCYATLKWHKKTHRPYVVSPHGMLDAVDLAKSKAKKYAATLLFQGSHIAQCACMRALCLSERDSIRAWGYRGPICVLPNGIAAIAAGEKYDKPWSHDILLDKKVLLYLGRIHPKKGLRQLIHALHILKSKSPLIVKDWGLAIVGWDQGNFESELKKLVEDLGLEDMVAFVGPLYGRDKLAAYHSATAFVLPSTSEGVPNVVLEAWTNYLPVLMTPECNIPEGFSTGAALRADPTPESLSDGLRSLFELSESGRIEMGRKGFQLTCDKFSWSKVAEQMKQVFSWLLTGGGVPSCVEIF